MFALGVVISAVAAFGGVGHTSPGFETGTCAYPAGAPLPGSNANPVHVSTDDGLRAALANAAEGDWIIVEPNSNGEYHGTFKVTVPGLRITGTDRNAVSFNGDNTAGVGIQVLADRVVVENMTGHNYDGTAFYWGKGERYGGSAVAGVTGYWGRYLTAYNNATYGIYAFDARCGQFDHSYASGNADSGFYIGECYPCDAVIEDIVAEYNALGYSGTNAGGNLELRDSVWSKNAMGIVPNSLNGEDRPPQRDIRIYRNTVDLNNTVDAPGTGIAGAYWGAGIVIAGGSNNEIIGNTVTNNALAGIVLSPLPDPIVEVPPPSPIWISSGNSVRGNNVTSPAFADSIDLVQAATSGPNNCWEDNVYGETKTAPLLLETVWSCSLPVTPPGGDPRLEVSLIEGQAELNGRVHSDWRTYNPFGAGNQYPLLQTNMPAGLDVSPWLPALGS
jgi:hypothetical protein